MAEETASSEVTGMEDETAEKAGVSTAARRHAKVGKPKHSKRLLALKKNVNVLEILSPVDAFTKIKTLASAKFNETIDVSVHLGVDPRHGDQIVRGAVNLPHGTGKTQIVWVFARGEQAAAATAAGADFVGAEDLVERIQKEGGAACDILVATPDMMPLVGRLGQILKQKMPNPKSGTVTPNAGAVAKDIKNASRCEFRVEKGAIVHAPIGKASYTVEQLSENFTVLLSALIKAKPAASKGKYLRKVKISSTMGPALTMDLAAAQELAEKH